MTETSDDCGDNAHPCGNFLELGKTTEWWCVTYTMVTNSKGNLKREQRTMWDLSTADQKLFWRRMKTPRIENIRSELSGKNTGKIMETLSEEPDNQTK